MYYNYAYSYLSLRLLQAAMLGSIHLLELNKLKFSCNDLSIVCYVVHNFTSDKIHRKHIKTNRKRLEHVNGHWSRHLPASIATKEKERRRIELVHTLNKLLIANVEC